MTWVTFTARGGELRGLDGGSARGMDCGDWMVGRRVGADVVLGTVGRRVGADVVLGTVGRRVGAVGGGTWGRNDGVIVPYNT